MNHKTINEPNLPPLAKKKFFVFFEKAKEVTTLRCPLPMPIQLLL
jgi:hypothetical protein